MKKYLFADLDGTLIKTRSGKTFPKDKNDWVIRGEVINAIHNYKPKSLFIVSNQGGIEKGFVKELDFIDKMISIIKAINDYIPELIIDFKYCSSNDKENPYRKPNPGMVREFMKDYNCNKFQCLMIGDASGKEGDFSDSDKKCASNVGMRYMDVEEFVNKYGR